MQIEVNGPQDWLEQFVRYLGDQLEKRGYSPGPRVGRMESGTHAAFLKEDAIISVQVSEENESQVSTLRLESETDVPGIAEIWDDAVIALGQEFLARLGALARDTKRVEQALKK